MPTATPADLSITPRDRRFPRGAGLKRWWLGGDPVRTAIFNALSVTFPRGEALFIDAVRRHRDGVAEPLASEIAAFVKQEVVHSREHLAFNRRVTEGGYDVSRLEASVVRRLDVIAQQPPIVALAVTIALEHFTAILAHAVLANPEILAGADPDSEALWRWHAVEEIEHKGVAFDTWAHATRDWSPGKRWLVRSAVMLRVTRHFLTDRARGILDLLAQDGITGPRAWARLAWSLLGSPGVLRRVTPAWAGYFRPGFHPWHHDDRALVARVEPALALA